MIKLKIRLAIIIKIKYSIKKGDKNETKSKRKTMGIS